MIITEFKPFAMIRSDLDKKDKIGIVSCNACARMCETGGKEKMEEIKQRLEKEGYNVVDMDLIGIACDSKQLKTAEFEGDTLVVLACDAGVHNLKKMFPEKNIVAALTTVGLGAWSSEGNLELVKRFE